MNILQKLVFAAKLKNNVTKLEKAIAEEKKMGYDVKVGISKALRDFVITSAAVGGAAVLQYFSVTDNLAKLLGFLPDNIEHAAIAVISPMIVFGINWLKERNKTS